MFAEPEKLAALYSANTLRSIECVGYFDNEKISEYTLRDFRAGRFVRGKWKKRWDHNGLGRCAAAGGTSVPSGTIGGDISGGEYLGTNRGIFSIQL